VIWLFLREQSAVGFLTWQLLRVSVNLRASVRKDVGCSSASLRPREKDVGCSLVPASLDWTLIFNFFLWQKEISNSHSLTEARRARRKDKNRDLVLAVPPRLRALCASARRLLVISWVPASLEWVFNIPLLTVADF
jgi:hypothetical protein